MAKPRQVYSTDLNDTEWLLIEQLLPAPSQTGRPREHSYRDILNAIWLILTGLIGLTSFSFQGLPLVMAILAIVAGVLILIGR